MKKFFPKTLVQSKSIQFASLYLPKFPNIDNQIINLVLYKAAFLWNISQTKIDGFILSKFKRILILVFIINLKLIILATLKIQCNKLKADSKISNLLINLTFFIVNFSFNGQPWCLVDTLLKHKVRTWLLLLCCIAMVFFIYFRIFFLQNMILFYGRLETNSIYYFLFNLNVSKSFLENFVYCEFIV